MAIALLQEDLIYHEMMTHPALFMHHHPKQIGLIGDNHTLTLSEIIKHPSVQKIIYISKQNTTLSHSVIEWTENVNALKDNASLDILINATPHDASSLTDYYAVLSSDGLLVQQAGSPFDLAAIQQLSQSLKQVGFSDIQFFHFPRPTLPTGWGSAFIAKKEGYLKRIREKAIYNRTFDTKFYNGDTHRSATVLPEFLIDLLG